MPGPLTTVFGVEQGDHVWIGYTGEDERRALWAAHVTAAAERGERAVLIDGGAWAARLGGHGDRALLGHGQVTVQAPGDAGFAAGRLDEGRLVDVLRGQSAQAARLGLRGLRVCVDLTGLLRAGVPARSGCPLAAVCSAQPRPPALICHGDRIGLPAGPFGALRAGHAPALEACEALRRGPLLCVERLTGPAGLRLSGEADRSSLDRLEAELRDAVRGGRDLHLDMRGLRYADVAAVRVLARTAAGMPVGDRLVLHAPGPVVRAILRSFPWDHRLVMEEGGWR
ncbi:STAS domain-containing protein [Actinomadura graeca]|uniref:STAS domain-containing protein n=1 Tax=Actinomadura graeca TaxID=2750812 RepID=A0ABX8R7Z0_9ACTN|nr:STAS domain-containing protein [Actinomadura graeca]QXJ26092.1 STAS domain-containing protein [Actinomadura graeca]